MASNPKLHHLPRRSPKVAKLYQSVWSEEGSPLLAISRQQQRAVQRYFDAKGKNVVVELGMSYGNPSIESATDNLIKQGLSGLLCYRFIRNTVALLPLRCLMRLPTV